MKNTEREDLDSKITVAYRLLSDIHGRISSADFKAQLLLSADAILAALVTFSGRGLLTYDGKVSHLTIAAGVIAILLVGMNALVLALFVLWPRLNIGQRRSLLFHQDIARMPEQQFIAEFSEMAPEQTYDAILSQIHANSKIATRKYMWIQWSSLALGLAIGAWCVLLILLLFIKP